MSHQPFPFAAHSPLAGPIPGHHTEELTLSVPLVHHDPARGEIDVFARIVTAEGGNERPFLIFLQGGPGNEAPRPLDGGPVWLDPVLKHYRVILLDQRGTGRSTPVGLDLPLPGSAGEHHPTWRDAIEADPAAAAEQLTHLRADEIVNDCEAVRRHLGAETVSLLGQSFGGFTCLRYLAAHPESLAEVMVTGGIPAVERSPKEVYAETWRVMREKSEAFYRRFPGDRQRMRELLEHAAAGEIRLPNRDVVSPERLRTIGIQLGRSGGAEALHWLLGLDHRSDAFRHDLYGVLPFTGRNPLYAVFHESCQANGHVTDWAAERAMPEDVRADLTLLGGEHIHRGLFDEDSELAPWKPVAKILAEHPWGPLYEPDDLRGCEVPTAAAVYFHDAFVPAVQSLETAALMPGLMPWVTSEYEHNGLRAGGTAVIEHLLELVHGKRVS